MCVIITTIDFYVFYLIGSSQPPSIKCAIDAPSDIVEEMKYMKMEEELPFCEEEGNNSNQQLVPMEHHDDTCPGWEDAHMPYLRGIDSKSFEKYKGDHFVDVRYVEKSTLISSTRDSKCSVIANPVLTVKSSQTCSAVVRVKGIKESFHLLRYDSDPQFGGILADTNHIMPIGFFRKASNLNGRLRIAMKMNPLFKQIHSVDDKLLDKLTSNGYQPNSNEDIIVMVVNDGELDMFMNFVCSCKAHGITLERVLVFCGSQEIVPLVEVTGAMGFYHTSFAAVNRAASEIYLDRTFVDMMWYKAFSVWLVLRLHYNVLFQVKSVSL